MSLNVSSEEGISRAKNAIQRGSALEKFREFVRMQGGNPEVADNPELMGKAMLCRNITADSDGYVSEIDAMKIGIASRHTGAGREKKGDSINLNAGVLLEKKRTDMVKKGDVLCRVYGDSEEKLEAAASICAEAFEIEKEKPCERQLIKDIIGR